MSAEVPDREIVIGTSSHERALCRATLRGGEQEISLLRDGRAGCTSLVTG